MKISNIFWIFLVEFSKERNAVFDNFTIKYIGFDLFERQLFHSEIKNTELYDTTVKCDYV